MMKTFAGMSMVRDTFSEAADAIGTDLWALVEQGPSEELNLTINTQPVMLTAGVALYRAWIAEHGARPVMAAGHSLGEYSALVAGGAIDFSEAVKLVRFRAQAMQEAVPEGVGAIAAILGLEDADVISACKEAASEDEVVEATNFNSPAQVVIAGNKGAVERAMEIAKGKGAKRAILLPMSAPSHCSLMRPAAERMRERLRDARIEVSAIPVLHNTDVKVASSADAIRDVLVRQFCQPVRWVDTVRAMVASGVTHIVECGPGKVLAGLNKRIVPQTPTHTFNDEPAFRETLRILK